MIFNKHTRPYAEHGVITGCITFLWVSCMKDDPWAAVGLVAIFFVYSCLFALRIGRQQYRRGQEEGKA